MLFNTTFYTSLYIYTASWVHTRFNVTRGLIKGRSKGKIKNKKNTYKRGHTRWRCHVWKFAFSWTPSSLFFSPHSFIFLTYVQMNCTKNKKQKKKKQKGIGLEPELWRVYPAAWMCPGGMRDRRDPCKKSKQSSKVKKNT